MVKETILMYYKTRPKNVKVLDIENYQQVKKNIRHVEFEKWTGSKRQKKIFSEVMSRKFKA